MGARRNGPKCGCAWASGASKSSSPEPAVALVWPYGTLATSDPLTEYDIDALVTYKHWPGATLFVPDETFARRLAKEAPTIN